MKKLILSIALLGSLSLSYAQDEPERKAPLYAANNVNTSMVAAVQGADPQNDDPMRSKNFSKTFPLGSGDKISLHNQYGGMVIKLWDKKEIKIDVSVKAFSNDEREVQKLIDQVTISAEKNGDMVGCKTIIEQPGNRSGRGRRREIKVNYVVYMPSSNALTLTQEFGNVNLEGCSGPLYAKVQYGDFIAGNLSGTNNYISVQYGKTSITELNKGVVKQQYGSGLTIGTVGTLDLDAQYAPVSINTIRGNAVIKQQYGSGLTVNSVNNLDLNVQYANVRVDNIKGNAIIRQEYNSLKIGNVGKLSLRSEYAGVNIGNLRGDGNLKMSYNNLDINEIGSGCKNLLIDNEYVDTKLNFAGGYNGDFTVKSSYSGFRHGDRVSVSQTGEDDENKNYSGKIGSGGGAVIRMKSEYGSVSFR
ncbi:hypothetical protein [Pedobacter cryoconitis]|uniref:Adhesin domain-containing protein n=1 Tax=Pedobacter cryoconitis TaxID=188932 RepID=A0A7X0MJI0_9SPHI|nr:hypothetical protein [Pedobacter cryoconitis]MBB6499488.1 hypothetical protein [Pedobacter cryoconitis]